MNVVFIPLYTINSPASAPVIMFNTVGRFLKVENDANVPLYIRDSVSSRLTLIYYMFFKIRVLNRDSVKLNGFRLEFMCYLTVQWGANIPLSFNLLKLRLEYLGKTAD